MSKFCSNCGTALRPNIKFCTGCGLKLAGGSADQTTNAETPALPPAPQATPKIEELITAGVKSQSEAKVAVGPEGAVLPPIGADQLGAEQGHLGRVKTLFLAAAFLVVLVGGGAWYASLRSANDSAQAAEFDPATYKDNFLSEADETVTVSGTARLRNYPTTRMTSVISTLEPGEIVTGRWVTGADPSTRWMRVYRDGDQVGYVWEGNLRLSEEAINIR